MAKSREDKDNGRQEQTPDPGNTAPLTAEDYKTEQEKNPTGDPVDPPQKMGPEAELNTISPKEPYPNGSPWAEPTEYVPMNQKPPEAGAAPAMPGTAPSQASHAHARARGE
jgi:hypothetical protein